MPARPIFLLDLRFADLTEWWLGLHCCGRTVELPLRMLAAQRPAGTLGGLLRGLRCRDCGQRPNRAVLMDQPGDRAAGRPDAPGGWRIEIVLPDSRYGFGL